MTTTPDQIPQVAAFGTPLHVLADALGVAREGPTYCAVCGPGAPFAVAGKLAVLGPLFSNQTAFACPTSPFVCAGCKALLSGRPGRQPPPLRMVSFRCPTDAPAIHEIAKTGWWDLLSDPDRPPEVVSWAESRKRQHQLHAGVSSRGEWRVGSDHGRIEWSHDGCVMAAVYDLRAAGASRARILTGRYHPSWRSKHAVLIYRTDRVLDPWRGTRALVLICHAAPDLEAGKTTKEAPMPIAPADQRAVDLLADVAQCADARVSDGLRFWGGFFEARVSRFARLPLMDFLSRLQTEIRASTSSMGAVCDRAAAMSDEDAAAVMTALRQRRAAIVALAFESIKRRRKNR